VELYQLRTFLIVAEEKSITRAAKRLFTTPPSVSAHIKALEDEWNVSLFRRTPKGMEITEKGALLRRKAEETILAAQDLANHATELLDSLMGSLRVGLCSSATFLRIPQLFEYFQSNHPGVEFQLLGKASGQAIGEVEENALDAAFVFGTVSDPSIAIHKLGSCEVVVACPKQWESKVVGADWASLAALPWIYADMYCAFQIITDQMFLARGLKCQRLVETDSERAKLDLITAGIGIALLEKTEADEAVRAGKAIIWPTDVIKCDLAFIYSSKRNQDPLIASLRNAVLNIWNFDSTNPTH